MPHWLDPHTIIASTGPLGVFLVLFAETGLLVGFFLPGDSLIFTAGLLAATPASSAAHIALGPLLLAAGGGAVLGAQTGFLIGRRAGRPLLDRPDHPRLQEGLHRASAVLERYGYAKAIVLARFIPVVRTLLNPLAGAVGVPTRTFTLWQVVGGLVWAEGIALAGHALGSRIPNVDHYLLPIIAVVVVVSAVPVLLEVVRTARGSRSGAPLAGTGTSTDLPDAQPGPRHAAPSQDLPR